MIARKTLSPASRELSQRESLGKASPAGRGGGEADGEGVFPKYPLFHRYRGRPYPSCHPERRAEPVAEPAGRRGVPRRDLRGMVRDPTIASLGAASRFGFVPVPCPPLRMTRTVSPISREAKRLPYKNNIPRRGGVSPPEISPSHPLRGSSPRGRALASLPRRGRWRRSRRRGRIPEISSILPISRAIHAACGISPLRRTNGPPRTSAPTRVIGCRAVADNLVGRGLAPAEISIVSPISRATIPLVSS